MQQVLYLYNHENLMQMAICILRDGRWSVIAGLTPHVLDTKHLDTAYPFAWQRPYML